MNYWWVNHKQTFRQELGNFYIWSPKRNRDGRRNQSYDNLPRVQVNDIIFSYAIGEIKAIGIVSNQAIDSPRPIEFGETGNQWDNDGWLVKVDWEIISPPVKPKEHLSSIVNMLPEKYSPIRSNGDGNQGIYLSEIGSELGEYIINLSGIKNIILEQVEINQISQQENLIEESLLSQPIPDTEKEQIVKSRIGQGLFRNRVEEIETRCRITGIEDKRFLIASHIKPWRLSDNNERLDGNNGLLLSPHVDKLFDLGWISFSDNGSLIISSNEIRNILHSWAIDPDLNVGSFNNRQKSYLSYHRDHILKRA